MGMPEMNFMIQTAIFAVVLLSMAFRLKGNYLLHGITMVAAVASGLVIFALASTLLSDSNYTQTLMNPTLHMAVFGLHGFFGITTFISRVWLVALWRPKSTEFPARSNRIAKIATILWTSSYAIGALLFVTLNTSLFA